MTEPTLERPRVLVVDDDPVVRVLAGQALAALGFAIEEAEDGRAALQSLERSAPDLVLLDVDMPGLNGFETCLALRRRTAGREIPVLIATGLTDPETVEQAFRVGATDFIKKPLDWPLLQQRVRFLLRASSAFTELRRTRSDLRTSEARLASAQRIAKLGHWEWVPDSPEMLWSEGLHRILGIEPGPGVSTREAFLAAAHADDRPRLEKALAEAASEARDFTVDHRIVTADGSDRIVCQRGEVEIGASGTVERVCGTLHDITDRRLAEQQIEYLASYDSITALPNRHLLTAELDRALVAARGHTGMVGLLVLNLDRFKRINDTLGHRSGDELLRTVARRLVMASRRDGSAPADSPTAVPIARLSGDEFAIVLPGLRSSEDAAQAARHVLDVLGTPFSLQGADVVMTASVGIAVHPADGSDADSLLRGANTAMRHAKADGGDTYWFFNRSMNERALRNLRIENGLRSALERGELVIHYQPQVSTASGEITGMEALVRWRSEEFGLVKPVEFIPLAEETGIIGPLGEWVIRTACEQAATWERDGMPPLRLAVNVSSQQMRRPELLEIVARSVRDAQLDPRRLELEITESTLLSDGDGVMQNLQGLRRMGVRLALDDFGTGFSSLSHLVQFPIDTLKIDQSFVKDIGAEGQADAIVGAVVAMAHQLRLNVVAEGVETAVQERFLQSEGCDVLQGFRIGRPVDPQRFVAAVRRERRPR